MKYYTIPEQELEETDDILSKIESETHGWIGDEITKIRGVIDEWRKSKVIDSDKFEEMAEEYSPSMFEDYDTDPSVFPKREGFLAALNLIIKEK